MLPINNFLLLVFIILTTSEVDRYNLPIYSQQDGYVNRDLLVNSAKRLGGLSDLLITDNTWVDLPSYYDRSFWEEIPESIRKEYIQNAATYLDFEWPSIKATDFLEIIRSGTRVQDSRSRNALGALVMGELVEGEGRFIDQIVNGVWFHCEQTWWGWSAHLYRGESPEGLPNPNENLLDLGVGEVAKMLAWTHYFFEEEFNNIHPLIAQRLKDEVMRKAVNPYLERDLYYWWWMGFEDEHGIHHVNNWVPWIHYNLLTSILLLENDPHRKIDGVQKILLGLDVFINSYPDDGGCDEGPSYWGAAGGNLFRSLSLLEKATSGKLNIFDHSLIQNMGRYVYYAHINGSFVLNFADAGPKSGGGGSRGALIYLYGKAIDDPVMQKYGSYIVQNSNWGQGATSGGRIEQNIEALIYGNEIRSAQAEEPLLSSFWLPQTGIGGARDQFGSPEGFYFAAKGGTNVESHNHNDVGSFMLYVDGKPSIIDVGTDTYVAETFRAGRYEIWNLQSQYHNLPKINGVDQVAGNQYRAQNTDFTDDGQIAVFSTEITAAYPHVAGVNSWVRSYTFDRGREFVVTDQYRLEEVKEAATTLNFMTSNKVSQSGPGILRLDGDGFTLQMQYDNSKATVVIEEIELSNRLKRTWQEVTRIVLELNDPGLIGEFDTVFTRIN